LKNNILEYNGIVTDNIHRAIPLVFECPRCLLTNIPDNKYCSKCSYPLVPEAYDDIKANEELRINNLEKKHETDLKNLKDEITRQFSIVFEMLQQNPELALIKPEILKKIGS
jgi:hypothetical protein